MSTPLNLCFTAPITIPSNCRLSSSAHMSLHLFDLSSVWTCVLVFRLDLQPNHRYSHEDTLNRQESGTLPAIRIPIIVLPAHADAPVYQTYVVAPHKCYTFLMMSYTLKSVRCIFICSPSISYYDKIYQTS